MNRRAWGYVIGSTILVLTLALLVALGSKVGLFPEPTDLSPEASAAILAVVGITAVGIERIIETLWTMLGQATGNQRWPLNLVGDEVSQVVSRLTRIWSRSFSGYRRGSTRLARPRGWLPSDSGWPKNRSTTSRVPSGNCRRSRPRTPGPERPSRRLPGVSATSKARTRVFATRRSASTKR